MSQEEARIRVRRKSGYESRGGQDMSQEEVRI